MDASSETEVLQKILESDTRYREAFDLVSKNSDGMIWLVGGMIYKNLVNAKGNLHIPVKDVDFVVERAKEEIELPPEWTYHESVFGDTRFVGPEYVIDFVSLPESYHIRYKRLPPTIENYLAGASLSVQAIAYDVKNNKLIDGGGLGAIHDRKVSVHNPLVLKYFCNRKDIHPNDYIRGKAEQLGFAPELML